MADGVKPLFALLGFAGCAAMQAPAGEGYRALGTEPFWSIAIADGQLSYEAPDGPNFSVPAPVPYTAFNGLNYVTDRAVLDPHPRPVQRRDERQHLSRHGAGGSRRHDPARLRRRGARSPERWPTATGRSLRSTASRSSRSATSSNSAPTGSAASPAATASPDPIARTATASSRARWRRPAWPAPGPAWRTSGGCWSCCAGRWRSPLRKRTTRCC